MKPSFEKLVLPLDGSIRCFDRKTIERPAGWHFHPEVEICFVRRGSGTRIVGDAIADYGDGDMALLGANLPHHWASDQYRGQKYDRHPALVLQFDPLNFGEPFWRLAEMHEIASLLERAKRGLLVVGETRDAVAGILATLLDASPADRLLGLLRALFLISRSDELTPLASEGYVFVSRPRSQSRLNRVCKYIQDRLSDPKLNQAELAELVGMNPSAFSRFFKHGTQRTVTDYVNELRIGLASRMLIDTDAPILEICYSSGYENASNFNRRFREYRGMSPRDYRALHRAVQENRPEELAVAATRTKPR